MTGMKQGKKDSFALKVKLNVVVIFDFKTIHRKTIQTFGLSNKSIIHSNWMLKRGCLVRYSAMDGRNRC